MAVALERISGASRTTEARDERLAVRRLTLTDFRSYRTLRLEIDRRPVVLTGPNGAGKTNLLEAISYLVPGRGLRGARLAEIDRQGGGPWAVAARLDGRGGPADVGTGRTPEAERRVVRIDGEPVPTQAALAEVASALWLTPAMDRLFLEGAAGRRRFLDRLVLASDPAHARAAADYGHALRERARLLRSGRAEPAWLGALERRAAGAGVAIAAARRQLIKGLRAALARDPGRFPRPELAVDGEVEGWLDELPALEAEARLAETLAGCRALDAESGTTAVGPHRSDLVVADLATGRHARDCSTGQQKALLISIVLAQARLRAAESAPLPLLLLDEVAAHLDARRRADLFEELCSLGAQAWLSGTDAALFASLGERAQFFMVQESTLQRHDPDQPRTA
jgi:DNA replication and repair protein RecF